MVIIMAMITAITAMAVTTTISLPGVHAETFNLTKNICMTEAIILCQLYFAPPQRMPGAALK